jgi:TDG/mug DNA glycosylase family protein
MIRAACQPSSPDERRASEVAEQLVPDVIRCGLRFLFVGVNPGLRSGAARHHFAHPSSRFWTALHLGGFTPRLLLAGEEAELMCWGVGLTNLVHRPTATAGELTDHELQAGAQELARKVCRYRPEWVAILGVGAYRTAFRKRAATVGRQAEFICRSSVWVLPGPTGRNAHFPIPLLVEEFRRFRQAASL